MQDKRIKVAMQCFLIHYPSSDFTIPCPLLDPKRYLHSVVLLASVELLCCPRPILNALWPLVHLWDSCDPHPHSWESLSHRLSRCLYLLCLETEICRAECICLLHFWQASVVLHSCCNALWSVFLTSQGSI